MPRADRRFVVSHVGSMVRPPAMIPFLQKHQAGEPYDKSAFEACLADSVIEAVRLQAETGIDVVSDGEYGKSGTWAFYVHRRLGGIGALVVLRPGPGEGLFLVLGRQDSKGDWHSGVELDLHDSCRGLAGNDLEMKGLAANHTPQAHDRVVLSLLGEGQRGHRQLERARHPVHIRLGDPMLLERLRRPTQQTLGHVLVVARDHHRDVEV